MLFGLLDVGNILFLGLNTDYTSDHFIFINFIAHVYFVHSSVWVIVNILENTK